MALLIIQNLMFPNENHTAEKMNVNRNTHCPGRFLFVINSGQKRQSRDLIRRKGNYTLKIPSVLVIKVIIRSTSIKTL